MPSACQSSAALFRPLLEQAGVGRLAVVAGTAPLGPILLRRLVLRFDSGRRGGRAASGRHHAVLLHHPLENLLSVDDGRTTDKIALDLAYLEFPTLGQFRYQFVANPELADIGNDNRVAGFDGRCVGPGGLRTQHRLVERETTQEQSAQCGPLRCFQLDWCWTDPSILLYGRPFDDVGGIHWD